MFLHSSSIATAITRGIWSYYVSLSIFLIVESYNFSRQLTQLRDNCETTSPVEIKASFLPVDSCESLVVLQHLISPVLHDPTSYFYKISSQFNNIKQYLYLHLKCMRILWKKHRG